MKQKTDAELVELLKKGSHQAFTEIFDRYYVQLYHFARGRLNFNKDEAKDLVHDIFTKIWDERETINIIYADLGAILHVSVRNRVYNVHKHHNVERKYMDHLEAYLLTQHHTEATDHLARTKELATVINNAIAALPEKLKVAFNLMKFSGMNRKQVAEHLGVPEQTVKTWVQRALARLKKDIYRGE